MTASQSTGLPSSPVLIDNGRQSVLGTANSNHKFWSSQHLYIVHGILLVFSFIALMPIGMAVIGSGVQNSFRVHWITQITSVITAVSGSSLGVFLSGTSIQVCMVTNETVFFLSRAKTQLMNGLRRQTSLQRSEECINPLASCYFFVFLHSQVWVICTMCDT
jgi:hypothetical protein